MRVKSAVLCILSIVLLSLLMTANCLLASENRTVRVGWFPFSGYQELDRNGNPQGYNYEYLTEIAKYTGWKYEFVKCTWSEGMKMVERGDVDILGCMYKAKGREEKYAYPQFDCGTTNVTLFVRADSSVKPYDFNSFNNMRVACCMSTNNDEELLKFAKANGFSIRLVNYENVPEILKAVECGDVDAGTASSQNTRGDIKVVAGFAPASFYFVTTKGNIAVLSGLNKAINAIKIDNNYYDKDLALKYDQSNKPDFIAKLKRLPVMFVLLTAIILLVIVIALAIFSINKVKSMKMVQKLLYRDSLTGLYNKYGFEKRGRAILSRSSDEKKYAIVALDINEFHQYNEFNGIDAGDNLLRILGSTALGILKRDELCARYSADDFVLLMSMTDEDYLRERIYEWDKLLRSSVKNYSIRIIYGIYVVQNKDSAVQSMYDRAVFALKTNRISNSDSVNINFYNDSSYEEQLENLALLSYADTSFRNGEFLVYYQPKYHSVSEAVVGAEALARWKRPDGSLIPPIKFIELFEKNGIITKLDFCIFEKVCQHISDRIAKGLMTVPISVNFSRAHILDPSFPERADKIAEKYHIPRHMLEIELTESSFTLDASVLAETLDNLHKYGFKVAIDDFGSGYSALGILKDIKADTIKMDLSFLVGFESGGRVGTILTSVIHMAKRIGLSVVVEGVETKKQADFIKSVGGDVIQGYYYSKPMPENAWEELLNNAERTVEAVPNDCAESLSNEDIRALMGDSSLINLLLKGLCGGFALYEYIDGRLDLMRVNDGYRKIMSATENSMDSYSRDAIRVVMPEDRDSFNNAIKNAIATGEPSTVRFHRIDDGGHIIYLEGTILLLKDSKIAPVICITFHSLNTTDPVL